MINYEFLARVHRHHDKLEKTILVKTQSDQTEHEIRRAVVQKYLSEGYTVRKLLRVEFDSEHKAKSDSSKR